MIAVAVAVVLRPAPLFFAAAAAAAELTAAAVALMMAAAVEVAGDVRLSWYLGSRGDDGLYSSSLLLSVEALLLALLGEDDRSCPWPLQDTRHTRTC